MAGTPLFSHESRGQDFYGFPLAVRRLSGNCDTLNIVLRASQLETLRALEGVVDVYLPDFKYADPSLAARWSAAADYPSVAEAAIREMARQTGPAAFDDDGMLLRGTLVRHLVLPGRLENTRRVLLWLSRAFRPEEILVSLMAQYTPCGALEDFPELRRTLT